MAFAKVETRAGWSPLEDNAPCHKAIAIRNFVEQQRFQVLEWPPYSPDMSPIENLWAIVKRRVHSTAIHTKAELIIRLKEVWASPEIQESCRSLIEDMHRRMEALCDNKGGPTKY